MAELEKKIKKNDIVRNNADEIIEMIAKNYSYRQISEKFGVNIQAICHILNEPEFKEKKEVALEFASEIMIEQAEAHLESIEESDNNSLLRKKVELSQFKTYLAKVKNRKKYDLNYRETQIETNNNIIVPQLTLKVVNNEPKLIENNESN